MTKSRARGGANRGYNKQGLTNLQWLSWRSIKRSLTLLEWRSNPLHGIFFLFFTIRGRTGIDSVPKIICARLCEWAQ